MLLAGVLGHLGLPWLLLVTGRVLGRHTAAVYDWGTVLCALPVLALLSPQWTGQGLWWTAVGAVAGVALPMTAAWLSGKPLSLARKGLPAGELLRLTLCAAAEELLWRAGAPELLTRFGLPAPAATGLALVGFALLHLPGGGPRRLPYHLVAGAVFTAAAATGGLAAAIACHLAHNLTLATAGPRRPPAPAARALPAVSDWE
ncbi:MULTISPECIES: type II CAAX prenyl endopeptidase Rce1 family protein [unclassified Crossiella]|uniref:CPBP family glutamic-type intramembrane protease n=1 Tax=unclassified Crossiella TaxID=2620835 RepID=UPI0020000741|nr:MULTISPECIES: CPBP family glutamic-type intramembrane protease [unclassified Crossiella]MCK2243128.1 CPBP family glutamic-type intramembrane protease [Crossiella sp. S99.2]MCK2257005.1 CPBP family glutamic-type intramembrane protease [Crossiella sp. S99.1]